MIALGVDGCKAGWAVALEVSGLVDVEVYPTLEDLVRLSDNAKIVIDMPIGLPEAADREVERLARARLGPRKASVFNVPVRSAVYADSYEAACARNFAIKNKKISLQSWYLCPKIKELDVVLRRNESLRQRVFEAHPELVFTALKGAPMEASKKHESGKQERIKILKQCGIPAEAILGSVYQRYRKSDLQVDDVLDALALFWVAKRGGQPITTDPVRDEFGIEVNLLVPNRL